MGTPKPLLLHPEDGQPMVRRIARALINGGARRVVVVVDASSVGERIAAALGGVAACAVNSHPERGMLSSIQTGLRALSADPAAFLVCPCDLPRLVPSDVAAVVAASTGDPSEIVAPVFAGKRGHPTLFGGSFSEEVYRLDSEKFGMNEVLRRHADRVREIERDTDAVIRDTDTPEEWRTLVLKVTEQEAESDA